MRLEWIKLPFMPFFGVILFAWQMRLDEQKYSLLNRKKNFIREKSIENNYVYFISKINTSIDVNDAWVSRQSPDSFSFTKSHILNINCNEMLWWNLNRLFLTYGLTSASPLINTINQKCVILTLKPPIVTTAHVQMCHFTWQSNW